MMASVSSKLNLIDEIQLGNIIEEELVCSKSIGDRLKKKVSKRNWGEQNRNPKSVISSDDLDAEDVLIVIKEFQPLHACSCRKS